MSTDGLPDKKLFAIYRSYIGEPDSERDVYVGFGLFLCGIILATASFALFVYSTTLEAQSASYFQWVEPAYALGMLALPVVMLGIVVLLPSERRVLAVSVAGVGITIFAVAGFLYAYPDDWNRYGADYSVEVVALYAVGLAGITASTGAALIAHYLDLARPTAAVPVEEAEEETEHYTDEEIADDIDAAMEGVELSWGGVEKHESRRLEFTDDAFESADVGTMGVKTTRSSGVQDQVAGLKGLKGGEKKTATSQSTVDDQTEKLKALREKKRAEELATADDSGVDRVRKRLGNVSDGVKYRIESIRGRFSRK